jgi:6-phosphofructokinase 1
VSGARIGILTAGGDAPGLNAAIRAVARRALDGGDTPVGVCNGWLGLLEDGTHRELEEADLSGLLPVGGTVLGSSRTASLGPEAVARLGTGMDMLRLDALVAIGGDGTLALARELSEAGLRVVGVPKTIDNDVPGTDVCIGFTSALALVVEAVDRLHTTAASHHQVMVLETMGRDTGWLAALGALAGGGDVVCLPEFPISIDEVDERLLERRRKGKLSSIVVVAEGSPVLGLDEPPVPVDDSGHEIMARRAIGPRLAAAIAERAGVETRATVLGHLQRGGSPVATDRVWAARLGALAYEVAASGTADAVAARDGEATPADLRALTGEHRRVPRALYDLCCQVG